MYYFKRWLIAIVVIVLILFFPVRKYLRQHGYFVFGRKNMEKAVLWAKQDSMRVADSLLRIRIDTAGQGSRKRDSIPGTVKKVKSVKDVDTAGNFYIIAGSFTNSDNAGLLAGKYLKLGYESAIISVTNQNGVKLKLVVVNVFKNFYDADKFLKEFQDKYDHEAWIYRKK